MDRKTTEVPEKALLNVKEMCDYLGIGQTKARELLADPRNKFTVRIGIVSMHTNKGLIRGF